MLSSPFYLERGTRHHLIGGTTKSDGRAVAAIWRSPGSSDMKMNAFAAVDRLKQLHGNSRTKRELGRSGLREPAGAVGETTMTKQETETHHELV